MMRTRTEVLRLYNYYGMPPRPRLVASTPLRHALRTPPCGAPRVRALRDCSL